MTNRRFFLQRLGVLAATCFAAPAVALNTYQPQGPVCPFKRLRTPSGLELAVLNEEWVNAPYEIAFLQSYHLELPAYPRKVVPYPLRFLNERDAKAYMESSFRLHNIDPKAVERNRMKAIRTHENFAESLTRSLNSV